MKKERGEEGEQQPVENGKREKCRTENRTYHTVEGHRASLCQEAPRVVNPDTSYYPAFEHYQFPKPVSQESGCKTQGIGENKPHHRD